MLGNQVLFSISRHRWGCGYCEKDGLSKFPANYPAVLDICQLKVFLRNSKLLWGWRGDPRLVPFFFFKHTVEFNYLERGSKCKKPLINQNVATKDIFFVGECSSCYSKPIFSFIFSSLISLPVYFLNP